MKNYACNSPRRARKTRKGCNSRFILAARIDPVDRISILGKRIRTHFCGMRPPRCELQWSPSSRRLSAFSVAQASVRRIWLSLGRLTDAQGGQMPATAFSATFGRELDVDQLAVFMTGLQPTSERDGAELLGSFGEATRADIQCSSCGKLGARVVRSAKSCASRAVLRQAHFRFVDPDGGDAHHPFCEFYGDG